MTAHVPFGPAGMASGVHPRTAKFAALGALRPGEMGDVDDALASLAALTDDITRDQQLVDAVRLFEAGQEDRALGAIGDLLESHKGWVNGHLVMAQLLSQTGSPVYFEQFLTDTIRGAGGDLNLMIACLRQLSDASCHARVDALIPELRRKWGDHLFFSLMEAISASETGDLARADRLFGEASRQGGLLSLPHVRHLIRKGDASHAATLAEAFLSTQPRHQGGWGLLATAWRMSGDSRHAWLAERPELVRSYDLDIAPEAIAALAVRLRKLHVARHHPFDQSLRGGTQTAGRLFKIDDPEIHMVRDAFRAAIRAHLDGLPAIDPKHPTLGPDRSRFAFTDSWSVRLVDGGYHVSHFHPRGTMSSAFYVTLPQDVRQNRHAGWLTIGEPPECLNTGLPPLQMVEPKVGRLALFPSFMWHGTRPFPRGERMTIAFDTVLGD